MTRKAQVSETEVRLLGLIADIRAAVGDPEGKLMQDEIVEHCRKLVEEVRSLRRLVLNTADSLVMVARGPHGDPIAERSNKAVRQIRVEAVRISDEAIGVKP